MLGLVARDEVTLLTICDIDKLDASSRFEVSTYVCGAKGRVLVCGGEVDGVVDGTAGDLSKSLLVHGSETCRGALQFTSTAGRDDGVLGASSTLLHLDGAGNSTCSKTDAEEGTLETDV